MKKIPPHYVNDNFDLEGNVDFLQKLAKASLEITRLGEIKYESNPRVLVYQHDKVKLYHYHSKNCSKNSNKNSCENSQKTKNSNVVPLLVVFATVNRPEILDLFPDQSLIGGLLENGLDVYLLDWGYPDVNDKNITMNDYVSKYLKACINYIIEASKQKKINLLGICQGGLLCLCYSLLYQDIKNLILISSPIDFDTQDNVIAKMFKQLDVDTFVGLTGNVPGSWLTNFFISLRPFELIGKKYLRFTDHVDEQEWINKFLRVEKWLYDAPDQSGASFTELIKDFYQKNKLIKGQVYLGSKRIDLSELRIPVLNIMAAQDEIVPVSASCELDKYINSQDYTQEIFPSGHIGIYISDKVGKAMPKTIAKWLKKR
jgi:polyhydroxyalkanoate synthase